MWKLFLLLFLRLNLKCLGFAIMGKSFVDSSLDIFSNRGCVPIPPQHPVGLGLTDSVMLQPCKQS